MSVEFAQMYESLTEVQQAQVYNFVYAFYQKNIEEVDSKNENFGFGALKKYANPLLREKENEAWSLAMKEKHGLS